MRNIETGEGSAGRNSPALRRNHVGADYASLANRSSSTPSLSFHSMNMQ